MKKYLPIILALALTLSLAACSGVSAPAATEAPAGIPNPITEMTAQELLERTGISFTVPEGAESVVYSMIDMDGDAPIAQMQFTLNGSGCTARAQSAAVPEGELPDISGFYYEWTSTDTGAVGYNTATLHWNEGAEGYVSWYDTVPGLLYSVSMTGGATKDALLDIAARSCPALQGEADGDVVGDGTAMDHNTPPSEPATFLKYENLPATFDLDGNGSNETISIDIAGDDPSYGQHSFVVTDDSTGKAYSAETYIQYNPTVTIADLDRDGRFEILLCGDCGSDDYFTYAWRWDGELREISFTGELRYGNDGSAQNCLDGAVEGIGMPEDGSDSVPAISVGSFIYMLGTYGGHRSYALGEDGAIAPMADSVWTFTNNEVYLETAAALPATMENGGSTELPAGTKLVLTGTNAVDTMWFMTESGEAGSLSVKQDASSGSWLVGGINENDAFVSLPYAG